MPFKKNDEPFKYSIRGFDRIIEEKGNQFTKVSQIAWNVGPDEDCDPSKIKLDIRKYFSDPNSGEKMMKGVSFLTEDGPHELTHVLVEEGYGKTNRILSSIKEREDFPDAVKEVYGEENVINDDSIDLRDLL